MNVDALSALWATRDERYQLRRHVLSPQEIESVVAWRKFEAGELPERDRPRAFAELFAWLQDPPAPPHLRRRKGR